MSTKSRHGGRPSVGPTAPRRKRGQSGWKATVGQRSRPRQSVKSMPQWRAGLLEVECNRCNTRASIPLDAIWRPRATPLWKLEAALTCRSCRKGRYAPPVHMVKLTEAREITPCRWVHPDEGR